MSEAELTVNVGERTNAEEEEALMRLFASLMDEAERAAQNLLRASATDARNARAQSFVGVQPSVEAEDPPLRGIIAVQPSAHETEERPQALGADVFAQDASARPLDRARGSPSALRGEPADFAQGGWDAARIGGTAFSLADGAGGWAGAAARAAPGRWEGGTQAIDYDRLGDAVARALSRALGGMAVTLDGAAVGRLVADTVSREIADASRMGTQSIVL